MSKMAHSLIPILTKHKYVHIRGSAKVNSDKQQGQESSNSTLNDIATKQPLTWKYRQQLLQASTDNTHLGL